MNKVEMINEKLIQEIREEALRQDIEGRFSFLKKMRFKYAYPRDDAYYFFLALLCERVKPRLAVDLGTCEGVSSYCMAVFSPETYVVTLDSDRAHRQDECLIDNVQAFEQNTTQPMTPALDKMLREIGVLFVDTYHEGDLAQAEYERWRPRMAANSIMLFDGCTWPPRPSMKEWWEAFEPAGDLKIDLHDLHSRESAGFGAVLIGSR